MTLEQLVTPPVLLASAGILLLTGELIIRRAFELLLFAIGTVAGRLVYERLISTAILEESSWTAMAVMLLCGLVVAGLARNDVIFRNLIVLLTLAACLFAAAPVAVAANVPEEVVWAVFLLGAAVSPPVLVGTLVTALIAWALRPLSVGTSTVTLAVAVAYARLRHRSWYWHAVDHRLRAKLPPTVALSAKSTPTIPVLLRCRHGGETERIKRQLRSQRITFEPLPGGYLAAEVPPGTVKMWNHPLLGLIQSQPQSVLSADTPINAPPFHKTDGHGIPLKTFAERLRTDRGRYLHPKESSGRGTLVAILDTGVRPINDVLKKALLYSEDFTQEGTPDDRCGHGTIVAQHVLAVAPEAKLINLKVLDANGRGTLLSVMRALKYVAEKGSKITVLNMSLGAPLCHGDGTDPLCEALAHIRTPAVAAIGNSGPGAGTIECPGCSRGTIGVGAIDAKERVASFSSRGPCRNGALSKPDIVNYGVSIRVQDHTGTWITVSGTSFASPLTAGIAACCAGLNPRLANSRRGLYNVIIRSASRAGLAPTDRHACGRGLVNLRRAATLSKSASSRAPLVRHPRFRIAAAVAAAIFILATWTFLLDHSWSARTSSDLHLLGRIGHSGIPGDSLFTVDDGTGVFAVHWTQSTSRPSPGSIAYVAARYQREDGSGRNIPEGEYRFTIVPCRNRSFPN